MATTLLIDLLGQALGPHPTGVVNFNQLHRLLLEIISHLGHLGAEREAAAAVPRTGSADYDIFESDKGSRDGRVGAAEEAKQMYRKEAWPQKSTHKPETSQEGKQSVGDVNQTHRTDGDKDTRPQDTALITDSNLDVKVTPQREKTTVLDGTGSAVQQDTKPGEIRIETDTSRVKDESLEDRTKPQEGIKTAPQQKDAATVATDVAGRKGACPSEPVLKTDYGLMDSIPRRIASARSLAAVNELGVMENRLVRLETRLSAAESLPEMLMQRASEGGKPLNDLWHYTRLEKRMDAAEQSLDRSSHLVDQLMSTLSELKRVRDTMKSCSDRVNDLEQNNERRKESDRKREEEMNAVNERLTTLEKRPAADGGPSTAYIEELERKLEKLQSEVGVLTEGLGETVSKDAMNELVTWKELERALKATREDITPPSPKKQHPSEEIQKILLEIGELRGKHEELNKRVTDTETALRDKVNASDLSQLLSQQGDGDVSENVMAMLLELQTTVKALEGRLNELASRVGAVPSTLTDELGEMRKNIAEMQNRMNEYQEMRNTLATLRDNMQQLSSSSLTQQHVDSLGDQLMRLREQVNQLDQSLTSLSQSVSEMAATEAVPDSASKEALDNLHHHLHELQEEQDRLADFARKLAEEIAVKEDHIKTLYGSLGDLDDRKADRSFVTHEVDEKADRKLLEHKASRAWVDSNFTKLDQEIREARQRLLGQEEALSKAVNQLSSDVDTKLDRMEIEPLKQYFEDRFSSIQLPEQSEAKPDELEPAGMRRGLHFNCISCARPVIVHPSGHSVPALPGSRTLPASRSMRAYTTYELDLVRQHQRRFPSRALTLPATKRSCGGSHTTIYPRQKIKMTQLTNVYTDVEMPVTYYSDGTETEITGQDGHIYKGRILRPLRPPKLPAIQIPRGHAPSEPSQTRSVTPHQPARARTRSAHQMHS